jgi:SAM-dependent MidA family methyltransferase
MPQSGSDFVTAPELSPIFGQLLAVQLAEALARTGTDELWEFGAGTGALALQVLLALRAQGVPVRRYTIVDLSGTLRARQQERWPNLPVWCIGRMPCPHSSAAWCWATRCWTPCRCSCCSAPRALA